MLDILIKNARVADGTGRAIYRGHVGVRGGVIRHAGRDDPGGATRVIDGDGSVVAPGFIDLHTHLDAQVLWDRQLAPFERGASADELARMVAVFQAAMADGAFGFSTDMLANHLGFGGRPLADRPSGAGVRPAPPRPAPARLPRRPHPVRPPDDRSDPPVFVDDLPAGGRRLIAGAHGIAATFLHGVQVMRDGRPTEALPGRVIRSTEDRAA